MTLRKMVALTTGVLAGLALVTAASLVHLTSALNRAARQLTSATRSVGSAQELQIALLSHAAARSPEHAAAAEAHLEAQLLRAWEHVGSQRETRLVEAVTAMTAKYLESARSGADLGTTRIAFERLIAAASELGHVNVEQAREVEGQAARLDEVANAIGFGIGALVVLACGGLAWWLRNQVFRPVLRLERVIARHTSGDRTDQAPEEGPTELRRIATRFNELTAQVAAQKERQLVFLGSVVHDLRNPLHALSLAIASATRSSAPLTAERTTRLIGTVRVQLARLDQQLGDLLDRAQIEVGRLTLVPEPCDIVQVVRESVQLYAESSPKHALTLRPAMSSATVKCDQARIAQVFNNLLSNAIKYSPNGGDISVALEDAGRFIAISVVDPGVGIPASECDAIFEPFRRGRGAREWAPGVGLGLHGARCIVEAHGGTLDVSSVIGRGSTFRVRLPKQGGAPPRTENGHGAEAAKHRRGGGEDDPRPSSGAAALSFAV